MHGHFIGDPQVYRSKEDRDEAAQNDPIVRLRERLALATTSSLVRRASARDRHAALEFGRTHRPQPEDALKNVYA